MVRGQKMQHILHIPCITVEF